LTSPQICLKYNKMNFFSAAQITELVRKTPQSRDRYADFLRAFSIIVVVLGHWLSAIVIKDERGIKVYNAVGIFPGMWIVTWILQVMPLFFFVGGFSNARTINSITKRNEPLGVFYKKRTIRLLKPTSLFLMVWIIIIALIILFIPDWRKYQSAVIATVGPLWFLGVYLLITILAPFMLKLHKNYRIKIPLILLFLAAVVDIIRFGFGIFWVAWFNVAFIWFFVHQLGFFYEDGTLIGLSEMKKFFISIIGLAGLIIFTNIGIYPKSMIGTGLERISNMNPPTICIAMLSLWLVGLAMLFRKKINQWLNRDFPWFLTILANRTIMTIYLWHLTAYAIVYLLLYQIGFGLHPLNNAGRWWLERPLWIIIPSVFLAGFIKVFKRFEISENKRREG